ncbi:hypothetical protein EYZ11_011086 [Aspergillus tanneri]|uniref:Uncharacterized protein n=1 Tax=Aspergillus tanneri TaxID=1220188 RepID=A0A4S3J946_9EURO|nr:hypothetical protein EYZ11_011086 [Aspergillus tanneri]
MSFCQPLVVFQAKGHIGFGKEVDHGCRKIPYDGLRYPNPTICLHT